MGRYTKETLDKMRQSALKRDNTSRIAALPRGESHWNHNPNPSVLTMHRRIHRAFGKASEHKCVDCGVKARDWSLNGTRYTDNIKDYSPRCRSCHVKYDDPRNNRAMRVSIGLKRAYVEGRR